MYWKWGLLWKTTCVTWYEPYKWLIILKSHFSLQAKSIYQVKCFNWLTCMKICRCVEVLHHLIVIVAFFMGITNTISWTSLWFQFYLEPPHTQGAVFYIFGWEASSFFFQGFSDTPINCVIFFATQIDFFALKPCFCLFCSHYSSPFCVIFWSTHSPLLWEPFLFIFGVITPLKTCDTIKRWLIRWV